MNQKDKPKPGAADAQKQNPRPQKPDIHQQEQNQKDKSAEGSKKAAKPSVSSIAELYKQMEMESEPSSPQLNKAESYKGIKGPELKKNSPPSGRSYRKVLPAVPHVLGKKDTIPTSTSTTSTGSAKPGSFVPSVATRAPPPLFPFSRAEARRRSTPKIRRKALPKQGQGEEIPTVGQKAVPKVGQLAGIKVDEEAVPKVGQEATPKVSQLAGTKAGQEIAPKVGQLAGTKAGQEVAPKVSRLAGPKAGQLASPKTGQLAEPKVSQLAGPKAGQLVGPKAGQLAGPKAGQEAAPKVGQEAAPKVGQLAGPKSGHEAAPKVGQEATTLKQSLFRRLRRRGWRKKATHKISEGNVVGQKEDKADVEEVQPELKLLEDVDSGKLQEGFTAQAFQREKTKFVKKMLRNTCPIRYLLKLTGRFPFSETLNGDGTITYEASMYYPQGIYFVVVSVILTYLLVIGCFNLMDVMLNLTIGDGRNRSAECEDERMYEVTLIDRNIVGFAGLWTALCHTTVTSVNLFFKRHYMAQYLSFWSVATQTMHVDVATGIFKYSLTVVIFYILIMATLTLMTVYRLTATVASMPSLFSVLMFRMVFPCVLQRNTFIQRQHQPSFEFTKTHFFLEIISGIFLIYIFVLSKVLIIFYLHYCRMLVTSFKSWNSRFHAVLNYPHKFLQSVEGRTTYDLLFQDHCTLLSLIEGTDRCFSTIVESYLALQLVSIILETYFVVRNIMVKFGHDQMTHPRTHNASDYYSPSPFYTRQWDFIPGVIILLSNVIVLVVILKEAGRVSETAKQGLEVIRNKTMMGRKTDQELWFTLSMYFSYSSQVQLALKGSGFFEFDNAFVLTVITVIFSNLVTVLQFSPALDPDYRQAKYSYQNYSDEDNRELIGAFLRDLERKKDRHWIVSDYQD